MKDRGKILYSIIAIVLCFLISCAKGPKTVLEMAENATFIIYTFDEHGSPAGCGSGFFIDKNGTGITNYHVLDKSMKAIIKLKDGKEYIIDKVLSSDKKWDIVKFSISHDNNEQFSYLKFYNGQVEQGDRVYNLGAPMGLEQTFADGLVSSLRTDSHGEVVQVSIPISPGSSGSPIMNESGEVVAVATFKHALGENLNFGVLINDDKLSMMVSNPFLKSNTQFRDKDGFVILNIPSDQDNDLVLNALQFKPDVTIAYLSFTNLDMSMNSSVIWCTPGQADAGFYIEDKANARRYYMTSSTIGVDHENGTDVPLATVCKFQINFPPMAQNTSRITVSEGGHPQWTFSNIDLDGYRKSVKIDFDNYQMEYAYSTMREGQLEQAQVIIEDILVEDSENIQALNTLGIISYVIDNNQDAIKYFSEVIDNRPNSSIGYLNRSCVYRYQGDVEKAIADISHAISIDSRKAELYLYRADIYAEAENWEKALADINMALGYKETMSDDDIGKTYYKKAMCNLRLGNNTLVVADLREALEYATDSELRLVIASALSRNSSMDEEDTDYTSETVSSYFRGAIGPYSITMFLSISNGQAKGWYYYNRMGPSNKMSLSGSFNSSGQINLNEYDEEGTNTGRFEGQYDDGVYSGYFSAYGNSKTYEFSLNEI